MKNEYRLNPIVILCDYPESLKNIIFKYDEKKMRIYENFERCINAEKKIWTKKLSKKQVREIRKLISEGKLKFCVIARKYNITPSYVTKIKNNTRRVE